MGVVQKLRNHYFMQEARDGGDEGAETASCIRGLRFGRSIKSFLREWSNPYGKIGFGEGQQPYKHRVVDDL